MAANTGGIARRGLFGALGVVGAVVVGTRAEQLIATAIPPISRLDEPATIARVQASRLDPPTPTHHGWQGSSIGHTVEGRSIAMWTQPATREPAHVLVIGAIHGNEPVTPPIADATAEVTLPLGTALSIIPAANPGGRARNRRRNARGVDLHRNFPGVGAPPPGGGPARASAPETVALMHAVLTIRPTLAGWIHQPLSYIAPVLGCPLDYANAWSKATNTPRRRLLDQHGGVDARGSRIVEVDRGDGRATSEGLRALRRRGGRVYRAPLNTVPPGLIRGLTMGFTVRTRFPTRPGVSDRRRRPEAGSKRS